MLSMLMVGRVVLKSLGCCVSVVLMSRLLLLLF